MNRHLRGPYDDRRRLDTRRPRAGHHHALQDHRRSRAPRRLVYYGPPRRPGELGPPKKLEEASTISVEASKASAIASAESSKLAYESILLLTGGSAPDSAKKADSLDGFTPEPAK